MRRRIDYLRAAYVQAAETTFPQQTQREWLYREAEELEKLRSTFSARWHVGKLAGAAKTVITFPAVAWALAATGVSTLALTLLQSCLCHLVGLAPLLASGVFVLTFTVAFWSKRTLFCAVKDDSKGIYGLEDSVYRALGESKDRERPLDVYGFAYSAVAWVGAGILGTVAIRQGVFANDRFWMAFVLAGVFAVIAAATFLESRNRTPA